MLDSPHRGPNDCEEAGCSTAPDSSTACPSCCASHPGPEETPCTSSGSKLTHNHLSATLTTTSVNPAQPTATPFLPASTSVKSPLSKSKPSSPSSLCSAMSLSPGPATAPTQTSCSGQRRKGLVRKMRHSQRQRGRQSCASAHRDGGGKADDDEREEAGEDERMEDDGEQDEERMEEESTGLIQWYKVGYLIKWPNCCYICMYILLRLHWCNIIWSVVKSLCSHVTFIIGALTHSTSAHGVVAGLTVFWSKWLGRLGAVLGPVMDTAWCYRMPYKVYGL